MLGGAHEAPVDRYELVLKKYDWNAPRPPRGYQYGIGRGGKAFITTAELTIAAPVLANATAEEEEFFGALDALESGGTNTKKKAKKTTTTKTANASSSSSSSQPNNNNNNNKNKIVKLSLDDVSSVEASLEVMPSTTGLTTRNARSDTTMDHAEAHLFAEERAITASDVLHGRLSAAEQNLQHLLALGSQEEQTTWITHARAYREMGMARKAQHTLREGCARTGHHGPLIWEERLRYVGLDNVAARRQLLVEATTSCPSAEKLWLELLELQPPHEQLRLAQMAVMACPSSEMLWMSVLQQYARHPADQRRLIHKALQHTPTLPRLWAKLAALEGYPAGKDVFRSAAQKYGSLHLVVEAAKFVEKSVYQQQQHLTASSSSSSSSCAGWERLNAAWLVMLPELHDMVHTAQRNYLNALDATSRERWMKAATEVVMEEQCVWSSAMLLFYAALPSTTTPAQMVGDRDAKVKMLPPTWLQDVVCFVAQDDQQRHELLCAQWGAWLLAHHRRVLPEGVEPIVALIASAISSAPEEVVRDELEKLLEPPTPTTTTTNVAVVEEEEEELGRPASSANNNNNNNNTLMSHDARPSTLSAVVALLISMPVEPTIFLALSHALVERGALHPAHCVLLQGVHHHPKVAEMHCAMAAILAEMQRPHDAEQCLRNAIATCPTSDLGWMKLILHQRSRLMPVEELLISATLAHPRSEGIWLMRLDAARVAARDVLSTVMEKDERAAHARQLRRVCEDALREDHARHHLRVWVYVAVHIEAELLRNPAAARALLADASVRFLSSRQQQQQQQQQQHGATMMHAHAEMLMQIGVARATVEHLHGGTSPALEVVKEVLHQLPKTRDGAIMMDAGELFARFVEWEVPSARPRAASQVLKQWRGRDALTLMSVAKLYAAAGHAQRALQECLKAVEQSGGMCGDVLALMVKLGTRAGYADHVRVAMGKAPPPSSSSSSPDAGDATTHVSEDEVMEWVLTVAAKAARTRVASLVPRCGPLWALVAEYEDPSNVTLYGYRRSVREMLREVMTRIELA